MIPLRAGANTAIVGGVANVTVSWSSADEVDASAFLVGTGEKVRSDDDFVFYNQPSAAAGAVRLEPGPGRSRFVVALGAVPAAIDRVRFALTIHGPSAFAAVRDVRLEVEGAAVFAPDTAGMAEKALILAELYRRDGGWKLRAVGQGFNGGLGPLARHHGVDVGETPAAPAPPKVDLEKRVATAAPRLVSLAKAAAVSLRKLALDGALARVGLALDVSGSMRDRYAKGVVQRVVERIVPLAAHFDDDGALDMWAYGNTCAALPPAGLARFEGYVDTAAGGWKAWMKANGGGNHEPAAIKMILDHYAPGHGLGGATGARGRPTPLPVPKEPAKLPAFVVLVGDGGVGASAEITRLIVGASSLPIFWQFVGVGGRNYGVLERLDEMGGRTVDNCGFFALDDLDDLTEAALYDRLLGELPAWMRAAKAAGILV